MAEHSPSWINQHPAHSGLPQLHKQSQSDPEDCSACQIEPAPRSLWSADFQLGTQPGRPITSSSAFSLQGNPPASAECCSGEMLAALCCDQPSCVDDSPAGSSQAGPSSAAAAGWWWDSILDGCQACANQDYATDQSDCTACGNCPNPASFASTSTLPPQPWSHHQPAQEPCCPDWSGILEQCNEACFGTGATDWSAANSTAGLDDCPDCWPGQPATNPALGHSSTPGPQHQLTPATTPARSLGSPSAGLSELMRNLDPATVREILECCYCAPSATADPSWSPSAHFNHSACPTAPHEHTPLDYSNPATPSLYSLGHQALPQQPSTASMQLASQTFASLVSQYPAPQLASQAQSFRCLWGSCALVFAEHEQLAEHVSSAHLGGGGQTGLGLGSAQQGFAFGAGERLHSWDDCGAATGSSAQLATFSMPAAGARPATAQGAMNPTSTEGPAPDPMVIQQATSTLLKHLIDDHLSKLEPGLRQAVGKDLQASADAAVRLAAANASQGQHSTAGARETETESTSSTHTHTEDDASVSASAPLTAKHSHSHGHAHPHPHPHPHPHSHTHAHPHTHHGPHRHTATRHNHGHPYGVSSRTSSVGPSTSGSGSSNPVPVASGLHPCKWKGCQLRFGSSADLMSHLSLSHVGSGKAGYTCEWEGCERSGEDGHGKGFAQRQKVMRHLQTHTGDRPFVCDVCGKSFSEAMTLTQHMRVHTNERPYKCTHPGCEKAFSLASALTIHLRESELSEIVGLSRC